jgi:hypothetical protein
MNDEATPRPLDDRAADEVETDEPDAAAGDDSAARAKDEAARQSIDPAAWRKGGVGIDP